MATNNEKKRAKKNQMTESSVMSVWDASLSASSLSILDGNTTPIGEYRREYRRHRQHYKNHMMAAHAFIKTIPSEEEIADLIIEVFGQHSANFLDLSQSDREEYAFNLLEKSPLESCIIQLFCAMPHMTSVAKLTHRSYILPFLANVVRVGSKSNDINTLRTSSLHDIAISIMDAMTYSYIKRQMPSGKFEELMP
jgi:hypothetical protein